MSLNDIKALDKEVLTAADVAPFLEVNAQSVRMQARTDVKQLGFPASVIGSQVRIPKQGFIAWAEGR